PVTTTIASSAPATICCQTVRLTGTVSTSKAGEPVTILAREYGDIADLPVATVTSGAAGAWTATVTPQIQTDYTAQTAGGPGPPAARRRGYFVLNSKKLSESRPVPCQSVMSLRRARRDCTSASGTNGRSFIRICCICFSAARRVGPTVVDDLAYSASNFALL